MNKFFIIMVLCATFPAIGSQRPAQPIREDFGPEKPRPNTGMPEPIRHSFGGRPENISGYYGDNGTIAQRDGAGNRPNAAPLGNMQGRAVANNSDSSQNKK